MQDYDEIAITLDINLDLYIYVLESFVTIGDGGVWSFNMLYPGIETLLDIAGKLLFVTHASDSFVTKEQYRDIYEEAFVQYIHTVHAEFGEDTTISNSRVGIDAVHKYGRHNIIELLQRFLSSLQAARLRYPNVTYGKILSFNIVMLKLLKQPEVTHD